MIVEVTQKRLGEISFSFLFIDFSDFLEKRRRKKHVRTDSNFVFHVEPTTTLRVCRHLFSICLVTEGKQKVMHLDLSRLPR